jgi:hypothetical protein
MQKVFVSYAREDIKFVQMLVKKLDAAGFVVWVDKDSINIGEKWKKEINTGIVECDVLLAIHSKSSVERSYHCKGEWMHALDKGKWVISVFPAGEMLQPYARLDETQAVRIEDDHDPNIERLIEAIKAGKKDDENAFAKQTLINTDVPEYFPYFFNQDDAAYAKLIRRSKTLYYSSSSGYGFIANYLNTFQSMSGKELYFVLSRPTESNLRHMAYWSAWRWQGDPFGDGLAGAYARIRSNMGLAIDALDKIDLAGNAIQLRILDRFAPVPMVMSDPDTEAGEIMFGIYSYGPSTNKLILRPGTKLTRANNDTLYDHFYQVYQNIWKTAAPVEPSALVEMFEPIPEAYDFSKHNWE